jgi:hypothetical protein
MNPGKTRSCPHCKATILDSATVCPGCLHHLRFDPAAQRMLPAATPLRVEGTIRHPPDGGTWEYSIVLAVRNERGEEITRQVVGVGALAPTDVRSFSLSVELFAPQILGREVRSDSRVVPAAPANAPGSPPRPSQPAVSKSPFRDPRDPRARPPMTVRDPNPGSRGAPPLPRDPRPPALETHARTLPPSSQPQSKDRPKDQPKD